MAAHELANDQLAHWMRFIGAIGIGPAIAFFVLWQLTPKIDEGIRIAENVNAELILLNQTCAQLLYKPTTQQQPKLPGGYRIVAPT